jgi:hypothetical protein
VTSDSLPVADFPQFESWASGAFSGAGGPGPFEPFEGSWYVGGLHADDSYMRLARTFDLSGVSVGQAPALRFALSFDTEPGYDNVIVEAHTPGADDWTTLPVPGLSDSDVPTECEVGFLLEEHPFLLHYLTPGNPCTAGGTSGDWNRMTANSGGWQQALVDLSGFAGQQVEVSISFVTDPGSGGVGTFVDDTALMVGGVATQAEGFETGLGAWSIPGQPAGSPPNTGDFRRAQTLVAASVSTPDSVMLGFGVEQVADPAERAELLGRIVGGLVPR